MQPKLVSLTDASLAEMSEMILSILFLENHLYYLLLLIEF